MAWYVVQFTWKDIYHQAKVFFASFLLSNAVSRAFAFASRVYRVWLFFFWPVWSNRGSKRLWRLGLDGRNVSDFSYLARSSSQLEPPAGDWRFGFFEMNPRHEER